MAPDLHANFAYSTVATAPSPALSGTSLVVAAGNGALFPTPPFNATIWPTGVQPLASNAEIVRVTGVSTDTFTITRAQESSAARTVVVGDQIAATITKKTLTDAEAFGLIEAQTLGSPASTIDFQSIPATFTHLKLVMSLRTTIGTTGEVVGMRLNNDSGAHYYDTRLTGNGAAASLTENRAATSAAVNRCPGGTATAALFGAGEITIANYASSAKMKTWNANGHWPFGTGANGQQVDVFGGYYDTAAAVTRVTLVVTTTFDTGSVVSLYGLK